MAKNNEAASSVMVGFQGHYVLNVIPKIDLVFDEPDPGTVKKFTSPDTFIISVPVRGTCKNLFSKIGCSMWWIIKRDDPEPEVVGPLSGMIILDSADKFHVEIQGKTPEIDIVKLRLFGDGIVQYRIIPDIPRSLKFDLTSNALAFSLPVKVDVPKSAALEIGSKISIAPEFPKLFEKGAVRIIISEIDEEDGEYSTTTATGCYCYTWTEGNRKPCTWMVGFSRGDGGTLTYPETRELDAYEFGYDLQVSADGKEFVTVSSNHKAFTGIKRPKLESFKLVFENSKIFATGKISGFAPNTSVPLQLFLKKGIGPENTIKYGNQVAFKEVDPDDKGEFRTLLFDLKPMAKAKVLPDSKSLFAMMKIAPQVWNRAFETPLFQALDYDETTYAGLDKNQTYVVKNCAKWVCSEEQKDSVVIVSPEEARIRAFLRIIRAGEGTSDEVGYETLFGGRSFIKDFKKTWSDHPNVKITKGEYTSSAAGAYQILAGTWNDEGMKKWREEYNVTDFSPENQDKTAIIILKFKRRSKVNLGSKFENAYGDIIQMIIDNDIDRAILTASLEWASLPGSPYGQPMRKIEEVKKDFDSFLSEELEMKTTLHIESGFLKEFGYK